MQIGKDDKSTVNYRKDMIRALQKGQFTRYFCTVVCRTREMFLHGGVKMKDGSVINVEIENFSMLIYSLHLRKSHNGRIISEREFLVSPTYAGALKAWRTLRRSQPAPAFHLVESFLEENGFPNPEEFDISMKDEVIKKARYEHSLSGFISRNDVDIKESIGKGLPEDKE